MGWNGRMKKTLPVTAAAVAACAAIGSVASREVADPWYASLDKPDFQPPGSVFPIVWTLLYADLAMSTAAALDGLRERRSAADEVDGDAATEADLAYARALTGNLLLNAGWSWVFFRAHQLGASVAVAGVLALSSWDLVRRSWRGKRAAAVALVPYAGWCTFATVLSAAIWRRNR